MSTKKRYKLMQASAMDDELVTVSILDLSGGQNTRQDPQNLSNTQAQTLHNVDIGIQGQRKVRPGLTLLDDIDDVTNVGLFAFHPIGGTNKLRSLVVNGSNTAVYQWATTGLFSKVLGSDDIFDSNLPTAIKVFKSGGDGDVTLIGSKTVNWHEIKQNDSVTDLGNTQATGTDDPPRSNVATFYNGRMWVLYNNLLAFSDAYASDYSGAFDTQSTGNVFNMPVGSEKFLIGIRGKGLICGGTDEIRYITPAAVPSEDDDSGLLVKDGCVAGRTAVLAGDDIFYMAKDGVRGVFKTQFDTLQYKTSLPISYPLKDEQDIVNYAHIEKASAVYFDNKYFISLPVSSSTTNNRVWIYYPALNGWVVVTGWNVADWAVVQVAGQDKLYAADSLTGEVYQAWYGSDDNGTDIAYDEVSRKINMGKDFEEKFSGEVMLRIKATGEYTVKVYASFDESDFNKIGELTTADRRVNFAVWTLPMNFQTAGIYTDKFHIDPYGEWYNMQIKLTSDGDGGDDLTILQSSIITKTNKYLSEEFE